ncbi:VpaChn25_0724 family phage protein [Desulfobulbus propionicus]
MNHIEEFQRKVAEKRRLAMLCFLNEEPDRRMSMSLMGAALESYLLPVSRDVVTQDAEFLRGAGLVTLNHIGSLPALTLTASGVEVVRGTRRVDGIQRPPLD